MVKAVAFTTTGAQLKFRTHLNWILDVIVEGDSPSYGNKFFESWDRIVKTAIVPSSVNRVKAYCWILCVYIGGISWSSSSSPSLYIDVIKRMLIIKIQIKTCKLTKVSVNYGQFRPVILLIESHFFIFSVVLPVFFWFLLIFSFFGFMHVLFS